MISPQMNNLNAEYTLYRIPLDVAGQFRIDQGFGYLHVLRFEDASRQLVLDALIEVSLSVTEEDWLPLQHNSKVIGRTDRGRVRWDAQAGVTAVVVVAADASKFAADTPTPQQLVVASGGTTLAAAAVTVGTAAVVVAAADATRQSALIQNLGSADIYLGPSGVTTSSGVKVAPGETATLDKQTAAIYGISGTAGQNVRVLTEAS